MKFRLILGSIGILAAALQSISAEAHHSARAVFTEEDIVVEGYVTEFYFKNPHVSIYFDVVAEDGSRTQWMATGPATPPLFRAGWSATTIQAGQYLRFSGKKGRYGRPMVLITGRGILNSAAVVEIDAVSGSIVRVIDRIESARLASRGDRPVGIAPPPLYLADGRPNLGGTWYGGLDSAITDQTRPPLNKVGAALQAAYDPDDDPTWANCNNEPGLVRQAASFLPKRITQFDDHVLIEYEGFAGRRDIRLDGRAADSEQRTHLGQHVARYENDALVIETTQLRGNLTGVAGNALTDQTTTIETYRRADTKDDGAILEMEMIVTDPGHLTEPWSVITHMFYDPAYRFAGNDCRLPLRGPGEAPAL